MKRNISIDLETAKIWYHGNNLTLKKLALQAFNKAELNPFDFTTITSFNEALLSLYPFDSKEYEKAINTLLSLKTISKASAAMFMLNIIRKVLNTGYDLHLTKNAEGQRYTWYPYLRFVTKSSTYYDNELESGDYKKLGEITSEGVTYDVLCGKADNGGSAGLGGFHSSFGVGYARAYIGFLGCATKEIAEHFSKYFGMLIIEAMYSDMIDFQITNIK